MFGHLGSRSNLFSSFSCEINHLLFINHFCVDEGKERYMVAPNSLEDPRVKELCDVSLKMLFSLLLDWKHFYSLYLLKRESFVEVYPHDRNGYTGKAFSMMLEQIGIFIRK